MDKVVRGIRFDCMMVDEATGVVFKQEDMARITLDDGSVIVGRITAMEYNDCIEVYCKSLSSNIEIDDFNIANVERVV